MKQDLRQLGEDHLSLQHATLYVLPLWPCRLPEALDIGVHILGSASSLAALSIGAACHDH